MLKTDLNNLYQCFEIDQCWKCIFQTKSNHDDELSNLRKKIDTEKEELERKQAELKQKEQELKDSKDVVAKQLREEKVCDFIKWMLFLVSKQICQMNQNLI